tara:strand:- start:528 stop:806 length:279 start_codon:yes stop_codon:yes gene_type:complete
LFIVVDVVDNIVFDTPFDKIQLSESSLNFLRCPRNVIREFFSPAKRVEEFLTVSIQARFVCAVDREKFTIVRLKRGVILFSVIRDEPLEISE